MSLWVGARLIRPRRLVLLVLSQLGEAPHEVPHSPAALEHEDVLRQAVDERPVVARDDHDPIEALWRIPSRGAVPPRWIFFVRMGE